MKGCGEDSSLEKVEGFDHLNYMIGCMVVSDLACDVVTLQYLPIFC